MAAQAVATQTPPPEIGPNDRVRFVDSHRPALEAGVYHFKVAHRVEMPDLAVNESFETELKVAVAAPRYALAPGDVRSVFPPAGAVGDFSDTLPNAILNRATLPWERSALRDDPAIPPEQRVPEELRPPWMALLMLEIGEGTAGTSSVSALKQGLTPEPGDPNDKTAVAVVEVTRQTLKALLPEPGLLRFLTHVRAVKAPGAIAATEHSIVIGNRKPELGKRYQVHLISLEERYTQTGADANNPAFVLADSASMTLVSLHQWEFSCDDAGKGNFLQIADHLNEQHRQPPRFHLSIEPTPDNDTVSRYLETGFIPLPHRFRQGDRSVSWYHGPLVPGISPVSAPQSLPARDADELLLYNSGHGMFDTSYAAAWALGRLLALNNVRIARGLYEWKHSHTQTGIRRDRHESIRHLPGASTMPDLTPLPPELTGWFRQALTLLDAVPFAYLVPDERLLPPESVRIFTVDANWTDCLCDGAFSIGRVTETDQRLDARRREQFKAQGVVSGVLVRSALIAGWPDLNVDGYASEPPANFEDAARLRLPVLRREALSPNVLLVLFDGEANIVDLHVPAESLHFGFGDSEPPFRADAAIRVVDVGQVLSQRSIGSPADFGFQMIDHAPALRLFRHS